MISYEGDNVLRQCKKINQKQLHAAVLLEKVTVPLLVKKLPAFHGTGKLIIMITTT